MFSTLSTMSFSKLLKLVELQILYWIYTVWIVCAWVRCDRVNGMSDTRYVIALWMEQIQDGKFPEAELNAPSFASHLPPR